MAMCAAAGVFADRPNIILIMADDRGYECLSCNGSLDYKTPHLDGLAKQGVRFDHCYSLPICTPSRVKIMTGRYSYGKLRGGTYQKPGHTGYPNDCIFVFDPEFEDFCRRRAKENLSSTKDDPWLLGHFSDNEVPFRHDSLDRYLKLEPTDPGRIAAQRWVEKHNVKKDTRGSYSAEDREAFLEFLSDTYFRVVSRAIREADPNHLYFGSRFHGAVLRSAGVFRGCAPHVDVVSCNYYGSWTPDPELLANWVKWSGRPFIATERYAKGMDSGMANTTGAGWTVKTQKDRGRFYQNYTLALLKEPGCVGWHWFKYMDNDPMNTKADPSNLDSNKGIVSSLYEPYTDLLEMMRELNCNVYALRDFSGE